MDSGSKTKIGDTQNKIKPILKRKPVIRKSAKSPLLQARRNNKISPSTPNKTDQNSDNQNGINCPTTPLYKEISTPADSLSTTVLLENIISETTSSVGKDLHEVQNVETVSSSGIKNIEAVDIEKDNKEYVACQPKLDLDKPKIENEHIFQKPSQSRIPEKKSIFENLLRERHMDLSNAFQTYSSPIPEVATSNSPRTPPFMIRSLRGKPDGETSEMLVYKLGSKSTPSKLRKTQRFNCTPKRTWGTPESDYYLRGRFSLQKNILERNKNNKRKIGIIPAALVKPVKVENIINRKHAKTINCSSTTPVRGCNDSNEVCKVSVQSLINKFEIFANNGNEDKVPIISTGSKRKFGKTTSQNDKVYASKRKHIDMSANKSVDMSYENDHKDKKYEIFVPEHTDDRVVKFVHDNEEEEHLPIEYELPSNRIPKRLCEFTMILPEIIVTEGLSGEDPCPSSLSVPDLKQNQSHVYVEEANCNEVDGQYDSFFSIPKAKQDQRNMYAEEPIEYDNYRNNTTMSSTSSSSNTSKVKHYFIKVYDDDSNDDTYDFNNSGSESGINTSNAQLKTEQYQVQMDAEKPIDCNNYQTDTTMSSSQGVTKEFVLKEEDFPCLSSPGKHTVYID